MESAEEEERQEELSEEEAEAEEEDDVNYAGSLASPEKNECTTCTRGWHVKHDPTCHHSKAYKDRMKRRKEYRKRLAEEAAQEEKQADVDDDV